MNFSRFLVGLLFFAYVFYRKSVGDPIWKKVLKKSVYVVFIFFGLYFSWHKTRVDLFYFRLKEPQNNFLTNVYKPDTILGYSHIPNIHGKYQLHDGKISEFLIGPDGTRKSERQYPITQKGKLLYLGCSFTWGYACTSEQIFPYLVSKTIQREYINAAVGGYGYSQMLLQAEKLIPQINPEIVVFQISPWLADRGSDPFAPNIYGKIPVPYFYLEKEKVRISKQPFLTKLLDLDIATYRSTKTGILDYLTFYFNVGIPLFLYDDFHVISYKMSPENAERKKKLTSNGDRVTLENHVIQRLIEICNVTGSKLFLLNLGYKEVDSRMYDFERQPGVHFVDAEGQLMEVAGGKSDEIYSKLFHHWSVIADTSAMIDAHPNPFAHSIIAKSLVQAICNEDSLCAE